MRPWRYNDTDIKDVKDDSILGIAKRIVQKSFASAYDAYRETCKINNQVPMTPDEYFEKLRRGENGREKDSHRRNDRREAGEG